MEDNTPKAMSVTAEEIQELRKRVEWLEKHAIFNNPLDFVITEDGELTEYKGDDEIVKIPSGVKKIGNRIVKGYTCGAFQGKENLKDVIIPDSVISIGNKAFYRCKSLEKINIPDSVTSINYEAFMNSTGLKSINIPDSVKLIGDGLFINCTSLESINISNSVTSISNNMFTNCKSLKSINIPDSVTVIGARVFDNCTSLEKIDIPDSVTSIGENAFRGCTNLTVTVSRKCKVSLDVFAECKDVKLR